MSTIDQIKAKFQTGDQPNQTDYINFIEAMAGNLEVTPVTVAASIALMTALFGKAERRVLTTPFVASGFSGIADGAIAEFRFVLDGNAITWPLQVRELNSPDLTLATGTEYVAYIRRIGAEFRVAWDLNTTVEAQVPTNDPKTDALVVLMTAEGEAPSAARVIKINTFVEALNLGATSAIDIWAILDRLYMAHAHGNDSALIDWKTVTKIASLGGTSPTFTVDLGYTGNGAGVFKTGFNPSTQGTNFTLSNAFFAIQYANNLDEATSMDGGNDVSSVVRLNVRNGSSVTGNINSGIATDTLGTSTNGDGFKAVYRINAGSFYRAFIDTVETPQLVEAEVAVPNIELYALGKNNNGTADAFSAARSLQFLAYGGGLPEGALAQEVAQRENIFNDIRNALAAFVA